MTCNTSVSFVMPAFNCATTIQESVESIMQSNFEDGDEVIIVDDGSTDNTMEVVLMLKEEYPLVRIIHNSQNRGCPASRNIGIESATNSLLFNLDSDNILVPGSIHKLKRFLLDLDADVAAFGEIHFFSNEKDNVTRKWIFRPGRFTLADLLAGPYNPGPSGNYMYTKENWLRVGKYWEFGPGLNEAWGFTLKQLASGSKMFSMPDSYYLHRYGHASLFVRESERPGASSLMATRMITPFLELIDEKDAEYIMSQKGRYTWFQNLEKHPIRLKSRDSGSTGFTTNKKSSNFQIMKAKIIGAISRTLPNSIKNIIRGER